MCQECEWPRWGVCTQHHHGSHWFPGQGPAQGVTKLSISRIMMFEERGRSVWSKLVEEIRVYCYSSSSLGQECTIIPPRAWYSPHHREGERVKFHIKWWCGMSVLIIRVCNWVKLAWLETRWVGPSHYDVLWSECRYHLQFKFILLMIAILLSPPRLPRPGPDISRRPHPLWVGRASGGNFSPGLPN